MKKRKLLSLILSFILCFGYLAPEYVLAAPEDEEVLVEEEAETEEEAAPDAEAPTEDSSIDYSDVESLAYGSSAEPVEGVSYLPASVLSSFHEEELEAYVSFCDDAAVLMQDPEIENYVIYTDEKGRLCFSFDVSAKVIDGGLRTEPGLMPLSDPETEPVTEDFEIFDAEDPDAAGGDPEVPAAYNMDLVEPAEIEEIEGYEDTDLQAELTEEYGDLIEADGLFLSDTKNWFYDQLGSTARKYYDKAYNSMVKGGSTGYSYSTKTYAFNWTDHCNAISAVWDTYPGKFGWFSYAGSLHAHGRYDYGSRSYTYQITLPKSKYYSSSLNKKANKKVDELVKNAYSYASELYPDAPAYGIVSYFDRWICENNYYEYAGVAESAKDKKTKVYYYCHRQYGILLMGYGVCESYALAMACLCDKAGIPNIYVTGDTPGGGHAWNYIQMPDGQFYMLDSTWDDAGASSDQIYFLIPDDSSHDPVGNLFKGCKKFSFPSTAGSRYYRTAEQISLPLVAVQKGKKKQLELSGTHAKMITTDWASSDSYVAKVNKNGKLSARKTGVSTISCRLGGLSIAGTVVVYQISKLNFENNGKKSLSDSLSVSDTGSYSILVNQNGEVFSASELMRAGVAEPKITFSKKNIVSVSATVEGDQIRLNVRALKKGKTTVKVKFGGKTAKLTLKVN